MLSMGGTPVRGEGLVTVKNFDRGRQALYIFVSKFVPQLTGQGVFEYPSFYMGGWKKKLNKQIMVKLSLFAHFFDINIFINFSLF